jgi:hypothetical protein
VLSFDEKGGVLDSFERVQLTEILRQRGCTLLAQPVEAEAADLLAKHDRR